MECLFNREEKMIFFGVKGMDLRNCLSPFETNPTIMSDFRICRLGFFGVGAAYKRSELSKGNKMKTFASFR